MSASPSPSPIQSQSQLQVSQMEPSAIQALFASKSVAELKSNIRSGAMSYLINEAIKSYVHPPTSTVPPFSIAFLSAEVFNVTSKRRPMVIIDKKKRPVLDENGVPFTYLNDCSVQTVDQVLARMKSPAIQKLWEMRHSDYLPVGLRTPVKQIAPANSFNPSILNAPIKQVRMLTPILSPSPEPESPPKLRMRDYDSQLPSSLEDKEESTTKKRTHGEIDNTEFHLSESESSYIEPSQRAPRSRMVAPLIDEYVEIEMEEEEGENRHDYEEPPVGYFLRNAERHHNVLTLPIAIDANDSAAEEKILSECCCFCMKTATELGYQMNNRVYPLIPLCTGCTHRFCLDCILSALKSACNDVSCFPISCFNQFENVDRSSVLKVSPIGSVYSASHPMFTCLCSDKYTSYTSPEFKEKQEARMKAFGHYIDPEVIYSLFVDPVYIGKPLSLEYFLPTAVLDPYRETLFYFIKQQRQALVDIQRRGDCHQPRGEQALYLTKCKECYDKSAFQLVHLEPQRDTHFRRCNHSECAKSFCQACKGRLLMVLPSYTYWPKSEEDKKHKIENYECLIKASRKGTPFDPISSEKMEDMTLCPGCGTGYQHFKGHGCHNITCRVCDVTFCYNCGIRVSTNSSFCSVCNSLFCNDKCKCKVCPECQIVSNSAGDRIAKPCSACLSREHCLVCKQGLSQLYSGTPLVDFISDDEDDVEMVPQRTGIPPFRL